MTQLPVDGLFELPPTMTPEPPAPLSDRGQRLQRLSEVIEDEGPDGPLCFSLIREMTDVEVLARFTVEGEPVSKQRPRFSRKNEKVYNTGGTKDAEQLVGWSFRRVCRRPPSATSGFGVYVGFFCGSGQRRDVDNMLKLVLDGLNGVAWADDSQVIEVSAKIARWDPCPRTEVVVYITPRYEHPSRRCVGCGTQFDVYPSTPPKQVFCSRLCKSEHSRVTRMCAQCGGPVSVKLSRANQAAVLCSGQCREAYRRITQQCRQCGKAFTTPKSWAGKSRMCSVECRAAWALANPTRSTGGGVCAGCGGRTSRKQYSRCRTCKAGAVLPSKS